MVKIVVNGLEIETERTVENSEEIRKIFYFEPQEFLDIFFEIGRESAEKLVSETMVKNEK